MKLPLSLFKSSLLKFSFVLSSLGMVCFVGSPEESRAQGVIEGLENEVQSVLQRAQDSIVRIKVIVPVTESSTKKVFPGLSVGTGFFIDTQGHILTTASVPRGSKEVLVYWRGKAFEARYLGQDDRTNVSVLKIDATTPTLPIGEESSLKAGAMTFVVGYPSDGSLSVEYGFISDPFATRMPHFLTTTHIRSSVRVQPGHSGSPMLNRKGEVVGMVVYALDDGSSTFALPITAARKIQSDLVRYNAPRHGWTGLTVMTHSDDLKSSEALAVRMVYRYSPAHSAGIEPGDILKRIGNKKIQTLADLINATFYLSVGETVDFAVERQGELLSLPVRIGSRPTDQELLTMSPVEGPSPVKKP